MAAHRHPGGDQSKDRVGGDGGGHRAHQGLSGSTRVELIAVAGGARSERGCEVVVACHREHRSDQPLPRPLGGHPPQRRPRLDQRAPQRLPHPSPLQRIPPRARILPPRPAHTGHPGPCPNAAAIARPTALRIVAGSPPLPSLVPCHSSGAFPFATSRPSAVHSVALHVVVPTSTPTNTAS